MDDTTVWMVSGNKGGVGKSLFCMALASALEMHGESYAIFDGDGRAGDVFSNFERKMPARWGDFRELRPESHNCPLDEVYERTIHQLLRASSHLIVNTPDGADKVLSKWFDVTLRHTESHNRLFKFVYLMSDRPDGLEMIPSLTARFQFFYPVRNLYFGDESLFTAFNGTYSHHFEEVIDFPVLRGHEVRMLFDQHLYPYEALVKKKENEMFLLPSLSRSRILAWQCDVNEAIDNMIANNSMPNVKVNSGADL